MGRRQGTWKRLDAAMQRLAEAVARRDVPAMGRAAREVEDLARRAAAL